MKLCFLYLFRPSYPPPRARAYWGFSVWETAYSLSGSVPAIKQQSQLKTCTFRELCIKSSLVHSIKNKLKLKKSIDQYYDNHYLLNANI